MTWTVEVGKEANVFDRFILTTDDKEIAEVGRKSGVEVPFMRPTELAQDKSSSYDAVKHAVEWLRYNDKYEADWIILLEPTSPGRETSHIREVAHLISENPDFDSLLGISETPGHFSYAKQQDVDQKGIMTRVGDGQILRNLAQNNQDLPKSYYINSAIYAFKVSNSFDGNKSLWGNKTYGYIMDAKYSLDIDDFGDWLLAEVKMKMLLEEKMAKRLLN